MQVMQACRSKETLVICNQLSHSIVILRRGVYELNLDFSALYKQIYIQTGSEKDQYLISERGLQVPSIIGHHEVQNQNKM